MDCLANFVDHILICLFAAFASDHPVIKYISSVCDCLKYHLASTCNLISACSLNTIFRNRHASAGNTFCITLCIGSHGIIFSDGIKCDRCVLCQAKVISICCIRCLSINRNVSAFCCRKAFLSLHIDCRITLYCFTICDIDLLLCRIRAFFQIVRLNITYKTYRVAVSDKVCLQTDIICSNRNLDRVCSILRRCSLVIDRSMSCLRGYPLSKGVTCIRHCLKCKLSPSAYLCTGHNILIG